MDKKPKYAVALKYSNEDNAPKVIAKGRGVVAHKIVEKGIDEGVDIHENRELARKLIGIDLGDEIPEELFKAVATILAFVYEMDNKKGK